MSDESTNGHAAAELEELAGPSAQRTTAPAGDGAESVVTTTTRVKSTRPKRAAAASSEDLAAIRELELLRGGEHAEEIAVTRLRGEYCGRSVAEAHCGKLPAGTVDLVGTAKSQWGGSGSGGYRFASKVEGRHVSAVVKVPGRPVVDPEEQRDQEEAELERQAERARAFSGGLDNQWVWLPHEGRYQWTGPEACTTSPPLPPSQITYSGGAGFGAYGTGSPDLEALRRENEELKRKHERAAADAKLDALQAKLDALLAGGGGASSKTAEEREAERELRREEREAERDARREEREAERAAATARQAAELAARAEERAAQERFMTMMKEMNAAQMSMTQTLMSTAKPTGIADIIHQAHELKGLLSDDSPAAGAERIISAAEKALLATVGVWRGARGGGAPATSAPALPGPGAQAPAASGDADAGIARALFFLLGHFKKGNDPRDAVGMLAGFCEGAGLDARGTFGMLATLSLEQITAALADVETKETEPERKTFIAECRTALATDAGRAWHAEFVEILRATT